MLDKANRIHIAPFVPPGPVSLIYRHQTYASLREPTVRPEDNPVLAAYQQRRREEERAAEAKKRRAGQDKDNEDKDELSPGTPAPQSGALAANSIFNDLSAKPSPQRAVKGSALGLPIPATRSLKLDPKPHRRRRWERKMVIRQVMRRGRLTKAQILKRTERAYVSKSDWLKTSIKKLSPLANQIMGKSVEEAIIQMRFSKKKNAIRVREHLEAARDEAIVHRGMGLGKAEGRTGNRTVIRTKKGRRLDVKDRTSIYVDQAWVNRGPYGQDRNSRARGRVDKLRLPQTSITVLLKEEATRIREHYDRKEKENNKKLWVPLPDRPIIEQRPYYSWWISLTIESATDKSMIHYIPIGLSIRKVS